MANKQLEMSKVRKTIVLYHQGRSKSFISSYLCLSRNTVKKYINLYNILNLSIESITSKSDEELEKLFSKGEPDLSPKLQSVYDFFPYMEKELKKTGVTKQLMWEEYLQRHPDGLGWAIAQSPILKTTITLERLKKRGYIPMLNVYTIISPRLTEPPCTRPVRTVV